MSQSKSLPSEESPIPTDHQTRAEETRALITPLMLEAALSAPDFFICTSPEMEALERATADGKHGLRYQNVEQERARVHQVQGASHFVRLELTPAEEALGFTLQSLEPLTSAQDADATFALLYISRLLAPPAPLPANLLASGWIDFDDVLSKIGWNPRSTLERREMHARLYQFILFGERAQVIGTRRGKYRDKHTGQEIPTEISSPLWRIGETEKPKEPSLFPELNVPTRVQLVVLRPWERLLTSPQTAQYLPMGELLGAIPGNKPSGAWARVIGLALASFWRRLPREVMNGIIQPTRRELLERYTPKTGAVDEVLESNDPQRALEYWCGALRILVESGFLADEGEVRITPEAMRAELPRQNWVETWFNAKVDLRPGPLMEEAMKQRVAALPATPPKRKGGRPKKVRE